MYLISCPYIASIWLNILIVTLCKFSECLSGSMIMMHIL